MTHRLSPQRTAIHPLTTGAPPRPPPRCRPSCWLCSSCRPPCTSSIPLAPTQSPSWSVEPSQPRSSPLCTVPPQENITQLTCTQLWTLYNKFPTPTSSSAQRSQKLKSEIIRLKRELAATSPQDNFSTWAKLDRQHNKATAEFQKLGALFFLYWNLSFPARHPSTTLSLHITCT